jgi:hypothetical protein
MRRIMATWELWDEPDRQVVVAHWSERDVAVVFPLHWATRHGRAAMVEHAKTRIQGLEGIAGRVIVPGSVILAFSRHVGVMPREHAIDPDVSRDLRVLHG